MYLKLKLKLMVLLMVMEVGEQYLYLYQLLYLSFLLSTVTNLSLLCTIGMIYDIILR